MHNFKNFKIVCGKCGSESTEIYASRGGCDSCGYGDEMSVSCNNCHEVEVD